MKTAYIGLGSNLGDSFQILLDGWAALGRVPGIHLERLSSPYRTEPVGMDSDNWFVNAAGEISTTLAPRELLHQLHSVETEFGRRREEISDEYQDRTMDLDLLLYDQDVLTNSELIVPHPALQDRLFVLQPLCEIAETLQHPVLGQSVGELLGDLLAGDGNQEVQTGEWPRTAAIVSESGKT